MNLIKTMLAKIKGTRAALARFREMGGFTATFRPFGRDAYRSDLVRACIRTLADQTAKAEPICTDKRIEYMLRYRPNQYMNGKDFLYKVRTHYELFNTAFIIIFRTGKHIEGFYPMSYTNMEALEDPAGNIFIRFTTTKGTYIFSWDDIIVLRKDYNSGDIAGDPNDPLLQPLEMIQVSNESIANAVKSTANLRGIIKTTKAMLDPEDLKKTKDRFVKDFLDPATGDGIGALDASEEWIPANINPTITNFSTMKELRENLYRFFGTNDDIIMSKAKPEEMQVFYETQIEPFLIALSRESTSKVYSDREIAYGNEIKWASSSIQFMSMSDKLALKDFIDRGAMTPNTWNDIVGLPHVEGGDKPIRRLDTAPVGEVAKSVQKEEKEDESEDE
ncbi:MAG: phage portal protein [Lachnospiraceae bacterium]|nr:phage portal protein [Lachnospiraceae bacterium]